MEFITVAAIIFSLGMMNIIITNKMMDYVTSFRNDSWEHEANDVLDKWFVVKSIIQAKLLYMVAMIVLFSAVGFIIIPMLVLVIFKIKSKESVR